MKKKIALTAVAFLSTVALSACSTVGSGDSASGTTIGDTIKVGFNFELSGSTSSYGNAEKNGAQLAIDEINAAGGVDGKQLEVVSKDNKSETSEASTVSTSLVSENVNFVVGPATSGAAAAAIPALESAGIPMITPSATQDNLVYNSSGDVYSDFFRTTFVDSYQGELLASYSTDKLQAKKVVLYYDNSSDYAKGIADSFKDAYDGEIVKTLTFASGDTDFQAALTSLNGLDYDAIVMPGYYTETGLIVKQARDLGINVPILGPDGFDSPQFVETATASAATNVYYLTAFSTEGSDKAKTFHDAYVAKYGEEPSMFAALAYDSVYMGAKAAEGAKTSVDISENFEKLTDYEGVTGTMSVNKDHNVEKSAYIVSLTNGETASVETVSAD